jgi:hypothetical protein
MAVAQLHAYIDPFSAWYRPAERDAAAFVLDGAAPLLENGKPVLVSEFGYRGSGASAPMNGRDPEGIALHNALWAGVFGGAAGTPMLWWWDNYIHPENLYTHYRGLTRTLAGTDWTAAWKPLRTEEGGLRVLALHRPRQTLLWVQNLQNVWFHRILQGKAPARIEDAVLHLDGFAPGSYTLAWIDPYSGSILGKKRLDAPAGHLRIEVPAFSTDLAARIVHVGAASSSAERAGSITE